MKDEKPMSLQVGGEKVYVSPCADEGVMVLVHVFSSGGGDGTICLPERGVNALVAMLQDALIQAQRDYRDSVKVEEPTK